MHKSVFLKAKNYVGDPISEYLKISYFISNTACSYSKTIFHLLESNFEHSELLRPFYLDLSDCLSKNASHLFECDDTYSYADMKSDYKEAILDEFLNYCEIISHIYYILYYGDVTRYRDDYDLDVLRQCIEMIHCSLKSINYKLILKNKDDYEVEIIKNNELAEIVAEQSPSNIQKSIIEYLGARDSDIKNKEDKLHNIIDLLEPIIKKYKNQETISKIGEYIQLIRHPELKKTDKQYNWFFENKTEYLDTIFDMCMYIQLHSIVKDSIIAFEKLKSK